MIEEQSLPDFVREHDVDPVTLDIIENALKNIRHEMDRVLVTTAVSPIIREQADEFPLIADRQGRMIVGQFGSPVDTVLENSPYKVEDLKDGDVIALNDPYMMEGSTSHLPDILLVRPIFHGEDEASEHVGYALQWGNLMDVGGSTAGSIPIDARTIYEEGVRMPPVKLYDGGRLNEEVLRFFCHNSRTPRETRADVMAIAAGTAAGAQRVKDICDRFGKDTYLEACDALLDRTRTSIVGLIRQLIPEDQRFEFEDYTDDDGLGNGPIKLKLAMWREGDTLHLDWAGTDEQVPGPVNFLLNKEMFQMFAGVFLISAVDPTILFNDGYADVIKVNIPDGSVLRPKAPAPLSNRLVVMARLFDVLGAVYAKAIGFNVSGSYGTSPNFVYSGVKQDGESFQTMEILYGGIPAIVGKDGLDGHSWWPEFLAVPAEYMETYYPLIVEEYSARRDSCGAGLFRGGCGIKKVYRFLADGSITYQDDRAHTFPYGVDSGKPGAPSQKTLIRKNGETVEMPSKVSGVPVFEGDRLVFETAGAGGVGDPLERDPALVAKDVRWNLIGAEAAASDYGVVFGDDGAVDAGSTETKREELRGSRGERPGFDRGDLPDLEEQRRVIADTRRRFNEWLSGELGAAREPTGGDEGYAPRGLRGRGGFGDRPALVVVDMSLGFTDPESPLACDLEGPVENIARLLDAARDSRIPVVFTTVSYRESDKLTAAAFLDKVPALLALEAGSRWAEIDPRLSPRPSEPVLNKLFASGFFGTPLGALLTAAGVDTLVVAGASTSGCVRATVVDALQHGFRPVVPREAVGDRNPDAHEANLYDIDAKYGDVIPAREALDYLVEVASAHVDGLSDPVEAVR